MIKKLYVFLTFIVLLTVSIVPVPANAAEELTVTGNTAVINYPSSIVFTLSAESGAEIEEIRLHYYVERLSYARITSEIFLTFIPGTDISATWIMEMKKTGGLPPGTDIHYWWTLKDASGEYTETVPKIISFDDTQYDWQTINRENITLLWYDGDEEFANQLLNSAIEGLEKLYTTTGLYFADPVDIYIYEDTAALRSGMIFPQEWTGGIAYPSYSKIAIGISQTNLAWGMRTVVHELTHLVTHRITENPYLDLPTWLDEGLSMYMEGPLQDEFSYYVNRAYDNHAFLTVRSLASPFSAYAEQSYLSYAQSYYIVEYLINEYGQGKILELLGILTDGNEADAALSSVYGFDMDGLNDLWLDYMYEDDPIHSGVLPDTIHPSLCLQPVPAS